MPVNFCTRVKGKATISVNYNNLAKYKAFMAEYTELNKSLARLRNNSNIDPIIDMFADNNTTYTVFEYIEGQKMLDYLKDNAGELSWEQVSILFPPLFTTVGILHNTGIIHRAISPETVFINEKGELKLSGFCVSAVRTADAGLEYELFKGYAAPEQYSASSSSRQGTWTDVYGLCALLYRALTGCMPVDSLSRLKHDDLCEPTALNPMIPPQISKVIMEGMTLSSSDRIQTITDLVTRLFEQPIVPVKPVIPAPPIQEKREEPRDIQIPPSPPPYYDDRGNYPPPPVPRERRKKVVEEEENMVDRLKVPIIIGVLLLSILLIIVVFLLPVFTGGNNNGEESSGISEPPVSEDYTDGNVEEATKLAGDTDVPNFIGKFYSLTETKYAEFFEFEAEYVYDNDHESDIIVDQDIESGAVVEKGTHIILTVSKGSEGGDIPEYAGLTVSQFENALQKAGISNYTLQESGNNIGTPDSVVQLQVDGKKVVPGEYFSNKDGKKLIVYYLSKDAQVVTYATEAPTEATTPPSTVAEIPTVEGYTTPSVEVPVEQFPSDPNPGEYGYDDEFDYW